MNPHVAAVALLAVVAGCGGSSEPDLAERVAMARDLAPSVTSFQAKGVYLEVEGEPAVGLDSLHGPGTGAVLLLPGRSTKPGERQCTAMGVRLVPSGERGAELLPIVTDAFEAKHDTTCGIP